MYCIVQCVNQWLWKEFAKSRGAVDGLVNVIGQSQIYWGGGYIKYERVVEECKMLPRGNSKESKLLLYNHSCRNYYERLFKIYNNWYYLYRTILLRKVVWNLETIKLRYCHESSRQRFGGSSLEFLHCIDAEFLKEHCPLLLELAGGEQQADKYFQLSSNFDFLLHSFTLLISLLFTPTMRIIQPHHPLVSWFGKHNGTQFYFKRSHSWGERETELSQTWKKK